MAEKTGAKLSESENNRPPKRPFGRSLSDFPNLSVAEKKLVACCAKGDTCELGDRIRPEKATVATRIRAELIRFLALGGDADNPVHEEGVMLSGAWIKGSLNLHQAKATVRLSLRNCHFDSAPNFMKASLPELALSGSSVPGIIADRMKVAGGVFLNNGFAATGAVRLLGANIGGNLDCRAGSFANADGDALRADGVKVAGDVFLNNGFAATGEVLLLGADIGGSLLCREGSFTNVDGEALSADGVKVAGDVFLDDGFAATGEVRLLGANIGGDLCSRKSSFTNVDGDALSADRMKVAGGVFLNDGFAATGAVRLLGANIGGNLTCRGGRFTNADGDALRADGVKVAGSAFLNNGFAATGGVLLLGADIGGDLTCSEGSFTNADGDALRADGVKVAGALFLRDAKVTGSFSLAATKVGTLADDEECWQSGGHMLDGFHYDRIIGVTDAAMRIAWLQKQQDDQITIKFAPQPWEQLIKVLREMGHPEDAAKVAIAKQDQWRVATAKSNRSMGEKVRRLMHWVYGWFAGYGHRPIWTVYWMAGIWFVCSLFFLAGAHFNYIGPSTPLLNSAYLAPAINAVCGHAGEPRKQNWTECSEVPAEYSTFQPFVYSLDLILPLVDLQQDSDWAPIVEDPPGTDLLFGVILRWLMWFEILFGWIASLTLVAVLGRLVDKD